jgi:hypothetical protein
VFASHLSPYQFGVIVRGGCETMVHGIQTILDVNLIGWCFTLTLQTLLTPFCVKPSSNNFEQQGGVVLANLFFVHSFYGL